MSEYAQEMAWRAEWRTMTESERDRAMAELIAKFESEAEKYQESGDE